MRIPILEQQVTEQPIPNVKLQSGATPAAFGVNVGQATEQAGSQMERVGAMLQKRQEEQWEKDNKLSILTNINKMTMDVNSAMIDPSNKILLAQENDAIGASERAKKIIDDRMAKYRANMVNQAQQEYWDAYAGHYVDNIWTNVLKHEVEQKNVAMVKQSAAANEQMVNSVAALGYTPAGRDALGTIPISVEATNSKSPKEYQTMLAQHGISRVLGVWLTDAINKDDMVTARDILSKYGHLMLPEQRTAFDGKVRAGENANENLFTINQLKKDPDCYDDRGVFSAEKAIAKAEALYGLGATKKVKVGGGDAVLAAAEEFVGMPYQMGGNGDDGTIDCSAFTQKTLAKLGIDIPRTADYQYKQFKDEGKLVNQKQAQKGDLVFFRNTYSTEANGQSPAYDNVTHVGIYMGDGKVLQAGSKGVGVVDISNFNDIAGFGQVSVSEREQMVSATNPEKLKSLTTAIHAAAGDSEREYVQRKTSIYRGFSQSLETALQANPGMTVQQGYDMVDRLGLQDADQVAQYQSLVRSRLAGEKTPMNLDTYVTAMTDLKMGKYTSWPDFEAAYTGKLPQSTMQSLAGIYVSLDVKEANNAFKRSPELSAPGVMETLGNILETSLGKEEYKKVPDKDNYIQALDLEIKAYKAKNDGQISMTKVNELATMLAAKQQIGNWLLGDRIPTYRIPRNAIVRSDHVYLPGRDGEIEIFYDKKANGWYIKNANGERQAISQ